MSQMAFEVFYDFENMTKGDPLHTELSTNEVIENINRLPFELEIMLEDDKATVSLKQTQKQVYILFINSESSETSINSSLKRALNGLSLFAKKADITTPITVR